jgi:uncharacterized damage-inducible protein DinB
VTDDPRQQYEPALTGDERETLLGFLDWHRATLAWKCDGLDDEQLRRKASPPSQLSLLGLVRHMAEVERSWFRRVIAGERVGLVYSGTMDYQAAYDAEDADVDEAFANWRAEIETARSVVASKSLEDTGTHPRTGDVFSLRWVLVHMIEEYARHNGHADFLREAIDGRTGE